MAPGDSSIDPFQKPILLAFLVWVTRQHEDALVTLCGLKLLGSPLKIGNLIEIFQHSEEDWAVAQAHVDDLEAGSSHEEEMIRIGFRELTGFEEEMIAEIRRQLQI